MSVETASALRVVQEGLRDLDNGITMHVYAGTGHSDAAIIAAARGSELDDLDGYWLMVAEGKWGWSPRFKHCSNHDSGYGCEDEGVWHRHFSPNYGTDPVTVVTLYPSSWREPALYANSRLIRIQPGGEG